MDAITRQKLEALLASLPTAADREALAQEFSHSSTPAADRQTYPRQNNLIAAFRGPLNQCS